MRHMLVALALVVMAQPGCLASAADDNNDWWQDVRSGNENAMDVGGTASINKGERRKAALNSKSALGERGSINDGIKAVKLCQKVPVDEGSVSGLASALSDHKSEQTAGRSYDAGSKRLLSAGAKLDLEEAEWLALHEAPGRTVGIELQRTVDGSLIYDVLIDQGQRHNNVVEIDAATGEVLKICPEQRGRHKELTSLIH